MTRNEQFDSSKSPTDVTLLKSALNVTELHHSQTDMIVTMRPIPLRVVSRDSCEKLQSCIT
jgi:hypothetical protein